MEALLGGEKHLCTQEGPELIVLHQVHQQQAIMVLKTMVPAFASGKTAITTAANANVVGRAMEGTSKLLTS